MTCLHEEIKTWYFEDTNQPAGMWSCKSCGHKFVPMKLWVGLTDDEFTAIARKYSLPTRVGLEYFKDELEAKLKEKNT